MSIKKYCEEHYWPYLCSTGRHKIKCDKSIVDADGQRCWLIACERCTYSYITVPLTLMDLAKQDSKQHIDKIVDILSQPVSLLKEVQIA